ncbi:MAG: SIS domain-containing protein [bacterium]|nr:SIS domain-containing protein [bacterium]
MCGICGILYDNPGGKEPNWEKLSENLAKATSSFDIQAPPDDLIAEIEKECKNLRGFSSFARLWSDTDLQKKLADGADSISLLEKNSRETVLRTEPPLSSKLIEHWNSLWVRMRDIAWGISRDLLDNLRRVRQILPENYHNALFDAWKLTAVLGNIGRLEVRGRDSLGISILARFPNAAAYETFKNSLEKSGLAENWKERLNIIDLNHLAIHTDEKSPSPSVQFVYKTAQEVGALGDNVRALSNDILNDQLLWTALSVPGIFTNIWSHTRWASNGIISRQNCHPVDGFTYGAEVPEHWTSACLNGDVDNFRELAEELARETGQTISPRITTDAKIIPVFFEYYYSKTKDVRGAFCEAAKRFEGSVAIALHTSLDPDNVYLALKGSGQSLYIGLCDSGYVFASELYGVVEQTDRFIRMDGTEAQAGHPESAGQIFILKRGEHELNGITAMKFDGSPIELTEKDIKPAGITTIDINRGDHEHFLLKEIFDAPNSIRKTLQGKVHSAGDNRQFTVNLGPEVFPDALKDAIKAGRIKRILLIGQGTAAVAGNAVASMMMQSLSGTYMSVRACKATELSGYSMAKDMSDSLVIAISQSGTTTDTNRTVDMARQRQAIVIAIVNRRNSDLVFKADGVMYTSDGRDIEMSVASTKAFYSQVVAGYLIGLQIASITGSMTPAEISDEIRELTEIPEKMLKILEERDKVRDLARKYATTKRDWAVVGSGSTRAAAEEIRIKLSELCYKSIATDYIEDKKHIDLSSEPLTFVCTAGLPQMALNDAVKEIAIFKSHKSIPIVVCTEGFKDFEKYAAGVIYVPASSVNASVLLNTVVGHLWGYFCAYAINESSEWLRKARALAVEHLTSDGGLVLNQTNMRRMLKLGIPFDKMLKSGMLNSSLSVDTAVRLSLVFQYFTGSRSLQQFAADFKGNQFVETIVACLSQGIQELSRPIDAIKHQAKTITVGISRTEDSYSGPVFNAFKELGLDPNDLPYKHLPFLRAATLAVEEVIGSTLYAVKNLNAYNEVTAGSTIQAIKKLGVAANLSSRSDHPSQLSGTKAWAVDNNRPYIGYGRGDQRAILIVPFVTANQEYMVALLHLQFVKEMTLENRLEMIKNLTSRYGDVRTQVEEANIHWKDEYLNLLEPCELATDRAAAIAEKIIARLR